LKSAEKFLPEIGDRTKIIYWPLHLRKKVGEIKGFELFQSYRPEIPLKTKEINDLWSKMLYKYKAVGRWKDVKERRFT